MAIEIRRVAALSGELLLRINELQRKAFPASPELEEQVHHNAIDAASVFYGAFDDGALVGVNGFIQHTIFVSGERRVAFQSCSSATDPGQRGKGIFSRIINHAKLDLAEAGSFICGFPNENSMPIFLGPLGFTQIAMRKLLSVKLGMCSFVRSLARSQRSSDLAQFDQHELLKWQSSRSSRRIFSATIGESILWGQTRQQRLLGSDRNVFQIGGISISQEDHVVPLFDSIVAKTPVQLFSLILPDVFASVGSLFGKALWKQSPPCIIFPLRSGFEHKTMLAFGGLADFF